MTNLFNKKILNRKIKNYSIENIDRKIEKIKSWQQSLSTMKGVNEKRLQASFLKAIFEDILGYENSPQKEEWTLDIEATTDVEAKRPDGIIGFFKRVDNEEIRCHEAVIELKGPQISLDKDQKRKRTTYKSPVDQAFSYTNKLDKCQWVIVSNFMEIRLYKVGRSKEYYEVFRLDELDEIENFKKFYYLLNKSNLLSKNRESVTYKLSEKTLKKEEDISIEFYNLYKNIRINLFEHLKKNNNEKESELLLEKAQKFLDRIIFIAFCEDKDLLPNDLLHEAIQRGKESFSPSNTTIWSQIKKVFRSVDEGNDAYDINEYNGGLFEYDKDLDGLIIENNFFDAIYKISDYDFDSDVDVNILGHIFEQSITDIEKIKSDIKNNDYDEKESRRKKDGIYYTPKYITNYIVENAIGGFLEKRKRELGYYNLPDIEEAGNASWKTKYTKKHLNFYNNYEKVLKKIKILDPACGSGAFLNQAFDYLLEEHQWLNKQRNIIRNILKNQNDNQITLERQEVRYKKILKNNLFGVDLNEESVEITKLSLWLKTANENKQLTNLDDNIKCGNSLIEDSEIAGDKAFVWQNEFNDIMEKGGFDVIVGNPPYGANTTERAKKKIKKKFSSVHVRTFDTYNYFISHSLNILKKEGYLGFIVPNTLLYQNEYRKIRKKILEKNKLIKSVNCGDGVFKEAEVPTCVLIVQKNFVEKNYRFEYADLRNKEIANNLNDVNNFNTINKNTISKIKGLRLGIKNTTLNIINNLEKETIKIDDIVDKINYGITTSKNSVFVINNKTKKQYNLENEILYKTITGSEIFRFLISEKNQYIIYTDREIDMEKYPNVKNYLSENKNKLSKRSAVKKGKYPWYQLHRPRKRSFLNGEKIILRQTSDHICAAFDSGKYYPLDNVMIIKLKKESKIKYKYLLGILNSKFSNYMYQELSQEKGRNFAQVKPNNIRQLIIPNVSIAKQNDLIKRTNKINELIKDKIKKEQETFFYVCTKYTSDNSLPIGNIVEKSNFKNKIYPKNGKASKIRNYTVNINTNIITIYLDKSNNDKYEVLKFEENDKYKRKYIKYYLENLTDDQLNEIDDNYSGNILKKTLKVEILDYNKDHVVKKVVKEWEKLQEKIKDFEEKIEKTDKEIDQIVYNLYDLNEKEIEIIEENSN